jgi:CheY-like chemotaxis protein
VSEKAAVDFHLGSETYPVACHTCEAKFDLLSAGWCACDKTPRSLICPHCSHCFCSAGARYKERLWNDAPKPLRESTSRFRLGDGEAASTMVPGSGATPRVLVVDDEEDMRSLVACYVEQMGYVVTSVGRPSEALALLEATMFEVVITDALMPGMDGRELCQKIKSTYGSRIKLIVMTSLYTANRYKSEARARFGVDEYLAKPLQFSVLKAAFDRVAPIGPSQRN